MHTLRSPGSFKRFARTKMPERILLPRPWGIFLIRCEDDEIESTVAIEVRKFHPERIVNRVRESIGILKPAVFALAEDEQVRLGQHGDVDKSIAVDIADVK
ncbi:MAG: hypothetical protein R3E58_13465 [Phycisphaerae bacterium]